MKDGVFSGIAGLWIVFWIVMILFRLITNLDYYIYTPYGRTEMTIYVIMALIGLAFFLYFYFRKNGGKFVYRFNKDDRCPDCFARLHGNTFCPKCGSDLHAKNVARTCWNCGYVEEDPTVNSCPKCGREFKKE